ncbi:uncharacterized protein LOC119129529 isoform X9 [Syngnathus acus]|uniref:uncharacterized protein LOC119129529 isoform X9 n=1 Tax=Syngnathus acus TaxID=161584 RepID=UPI001885B7B6|nr:uncharacterized protein LOC119129529 isoform X9 [Syngnathus acus]
MLLSLHFPGHYRSPRHMQSSCSMPHNARENPGSRLEGNSSKATSLQLLPRRTLGRIFNWPEAERVRKAESLFSSSLKRSHATVEMWHCASIWRAPEVRRTGLNISPSSSALSAELAVMLALLKRGTIIAVQSGSPIGRSS